VGKDRDGRGGRLESDAVSVEKGHVRGGGPHLGDGAAQLADEVVMDQRAPLGALGLDVTGGLATLLLERRFCHRHRPQREQLQG
jgi:hypothetical protein